MTHRDANGHLVSIGDFVRVINRYNEGPAIGAIARVTDLHENSIGIADPTCDTGRFGKISSFIEWVCGPDMEMDEGL